MAQKTVQAPPQAAPLRKISYPMAMVIAILVTVGVELLVAVVLSQLLSMLS